MSESNLRVLEQIIDYIKNNYDKDISLKALSTQIYLTPNYLGELFADKMNINFKDYLTSVRMEKAKDLIRENRYMIYEISEMVGYSHLDYFRKQFKKYTGINPSEYRTME